MQRCVEELPMEYVVKDAKSKSVLGNNINKLGVLSYLGSSVDYKRGGGVNIKLNRFQHLYGNVSHVR